MKGFLIFVAIMAWLVGIYFGYIHIVQKTMQVNPNQKEPIRSKHLMKEQRQKSQDLREKQKRLMEIRKRTLRNH